MVCQVRDYFYNNIHFQFKSGFAHFVYVIKNSRTRGKVGLRRLLRMRGLVPVVDGLDTEGL